MREPNLSSITTKKFEILTFLFKIFIVDLLAYSYDMSAYLI